MQKLWKKKVWRCNRQDGFSLIELFIVIALAGLIAAIGVPSLISMRNKANLRESASDVMSAFKKAQTEAVARNTSVAVAFGAGTCTIFVDDGAGVAANAKNLILDAGETVISTTTLQSNTSLSSNTFLVVNGFPNIEFNSRGMPAIIMIGGVPTQTSVGKIDILSSAGITTQYRVSISATGRVSLQTSTNSGGSWN
jgi:type II secretion system protein H